MSQRRTNQTFAVVTDIIKGVRRSGAELTEADVGRPIGQHFGFVLSIDVGKRVWLRPWGIVVENDQQRDARKGGRKIEQ